MDRVQRIATPVTATRFTGAAAAGQGLGVDHGHFSILVPKELGS